MLEDGKTDMLEKSSEKSVDVSKHGKESFQTPSHWSSPDELKPEYWNNPQEIQLREQEFLHKPIETLEKLEKADSDGIARREFLSIMGASMALASFACARRPVNKIIPYVVKPKEVTPGVPNWYASSCNGCSSGCGVLVKTREARPIKLEGNPEHPINKGKLCVRGQASLLDLYDPDRLKSPIGRTTREGSKTPRSWDDVDRDLRTRLAAARNVRVLTQTVHSDSRKALIGEFVNKFSNGRHVEFENPIHESLAAAQAISYGAKIIPSYRFDQADVVVSIGADFLGGWLSPVEYSAAWSKKRKLEGQKSSSAKMSRLYSFESASTITGANSDARVAIRAGDELSVALAIAHELVSKTRFGSDSAIRNTLKEFSPARVASQIGGDQAEETIKKAAHDLWSARGRGLVVAGGLNTETQDAVGLQVVVNLINSALGSEGVTVDGTARYQTVGGSFSEVQNLIREMESGKVDVLLVQGVNPAYTLPESLHWDSAVKKVPLVISFADREDETALDADYVLPVNHFLESWGDSQSQRGVYTLQQPVIAPIFSTRSFEDSLLKLMKDSRSGYAYLRAYWKSKIYPKWGKSEGFESFWQKSLQIGFVDGRSKSISSRSFKNSSWSSVKPRSHSAGLTLALYESVAMGNGTQSNNPWLQELPDPLTTVTWDNFAAIAPAFAKKAGLKTNDVVEIKGTGSDFRVPVMIQPGMHPDSVQVAIGYGRTAAGRVGTGVGVNAFKRASVDGNRLVYSGQKIELKKTGIRYELAATQGHHRTHHRPIINDITLKEYRENPKAEGHTNPHLRMETPSIWPKHEYKGYRWAMAVDLNSCTGCGSCVVACMAENNIPVVGRDRVRVSREMHWIRIDRYYSGSEDNPDMVFQPMMCQHCENASCETVCPVLATVHSDEGLNEQVYNRCVGTRYCQNNCPYKVRRFNFFDHWKDYKAPMNLVFNPDVTVRSRGIMEKCTFCVQRINEARATAKGEERSIRESDLKTACQQTCPTDAITFGDVNNSKTTVAQMRQDDRAFHALEVLNNVPQVTYLTKVRNADKKKGSHDVHH